MGSAIYEKINDFVIVLVFAEMSCAMLKYIQLLNFKFDIQTLKCNFLSNLKYESNLS